MDTCERFGVMLDCSRNAVMKVSEVKRFIDILSKMGYNCLELYTEDTYEIKGEPYFGYLRGRYTGEEIKEIDAYAKEKGVELIPCVQTLAHFTALVRHPAYSDIVDTNDILLIDEPKTYELIDKIFATLAENFTSRLVNIGMDEAHMVGLGKYLDKHGYQNRYELLLRHLNKVAEIAKKYGFKAHMWSDMFFRLANHGSYYVDEVMQFPKDISSKIPENVELVYWDYYHMDEEVYDMQLQSHKSLCENTWFAGGARTWNGFAPLNRYSLLTMKPAMKSIANNGVKNVLITMWGDNGSECSPFSALPSLYAIRQYALGNFDEEKIAKGFAHLFKISYEDFMLLDLPNRTETPLLNAEGKEIPQSTCKALLYADPFMGIFDKTVMSIRPIPYARYALELKKATKRAGEYAYLFESMEKLCLVLAVKAELGVRTRRAYQSRDMKAVLSLVKEYAVLEKRLVAFHSAFRNLWNKESKPQGWEVQDARLGGLMQRVKTCRERLSLYAKGKLAVIEELEEEILPYQAENYFQLNSYAQTITMSVF